MAKTFEAIKAVANTIKENSLPESNTANLVGGELVDIIDKVQEVYQVSVETIKNCGYYTSIDKLIEDYPNPIIGMLAYVGTNVPYAVYRCEENNVWVDSGETFEPDFNFYYNYNIKKTYASISAMNADIENPIGIDGLAIKIGDIVTVVNPTTPSENGIYSYNGSVNGWKYQSSYNFQVEQARSQNTNTAPNSKLFDDTITLLENNFQFSIPSYRKAFLTGWGSINLTENITNNIFGENMYVDKVDIITHSGNTLAFNIPSEIITAGNIININALIYTPIDFTSQLSVWAGVAAETFGTFEILKGDILNLQSGINKIHFQIKVLTVGNGREWQIYFRNTSLIGYTLFVKAYTYIGTFKNFISEDNKTLSTNDFTNSYKDAIENFPNLVNNLGINNLILNNLLDTGKCTTPDDIYSTNSSLTITAITDGLQIVTDPTGIYPQIIFKPVLLSEKHRYVILLDAPTVPTLIQLLTYGNVIATESGPGIIAGYYNPNVTENKSVMIQMGEGYTYVVKSVMVIDLGVEGTTFFNYTLNDIITMYKNSGFFNSYSLSDKSNLSEKSLVSENVNNINTISNSIINSKEIIINFLGDSIFAYFFAENQILNVVGAAKLLPSITGLDPLNLKNYGIGGNKLCIPIGGDETTIAGGGATAMCARYQNMSDCDYLLVMGGTNDISNEILPGSINTITDKHTIWGALYTIVSGWKSLHAHSQVIICITPRRSSGMNILKTYADAMKDFCIYYGIPYIDFFYGCGFSEYFNINSNSNLLENVSWTENSDLDSNGAIISGSKYVSDYINVVTGKGYFFSSAGTIYKYDSSGNYISHETIYNNAMTTILIASGVSKIRLVAASIGSGMINGSVVSLRFASVEGEYISDGVHPNTKGMRIMAQYLANKLKEIMVSYKLG